MLPIERILEISQISGLRYGERFYEKAYRLLCEK